MNLGKVWLRNFRLTVIRRARVREALKPLRAAWLACGSNPDWAAIADIFYPQVGVSLVSRDWVVKLRSPTPFNPSPRSRSCREREMFFGNVYAGWRTSE